MTNELPYRQTPYTWQKKPTIRYECRVCNSVDTHGNTARTNMHDKQKTQ